MTPMQQSTFEYIKQGLLTLILIVFVSGVFTLIVTYNYNTEAPVQAEPDCTQCGCVSKTKQVNLRGLAL